MKKSFISLMVLMIILALPGAYAARASVGLPNPVHEATAEEAAEISGTFGITLPEGAADPQYSYIDMKEGTAIFQVKFIWEGQACTYRTRIAKEMEDISGVYGNWDYSKKLLIGNSLGQIMYEQDGLGAAIWLDALQDQVFSVVMEGEASVIKLLTLAYANANFDQEMPDESNQTPFAFFTGYTYQADAARISEALGIDFAAPEEAKDIAYFLVGDEDLKNPETPPKGAVYFKLTDKAYLYTARHGNEAMEPTGKIERWLSFDSVKLGKYNADVMTSETGMGIVAWFDDS